MARPNHYDHDDALRILQTPELKAQLKEGEENALGEVAGAWITNDFVSPGRLALARAAIARLATGS